MFFSKKKVRKEPTTPQKSSQSGKKKRFHSLEVKLMAVEAVEAGVNPKDISEMIGSGPSTISGWHRTWREKGLEGFIHNGANRGTRKISALIKNKIEELRLENPEAGVRTISNELKRNDAISVSPETVRKVVNEAGLGNQAPQPKRRPPQIRRFERSLPNQMWQIDITTFELKRMYRVYLIAIIDDHSRFIVGHGLFRQQRAEAVQEVVQGAIGQWGAPREFLSDNGRQFASWRGKTQFQKELRRQGIQHVRSAPHHPMTLGKIERFWKTIKTEFLDDAVFASFADARQRIDHWIAHYNHQRPHQGIGGAAPADRFYGIANDVEEALKQGCAENALQLALGQETRPPLYLLGKLGETDVRVTRQGDEIQVKFGDEVHETIRMGTALDLDEEVPDEELAGPEPGREIPNSGDGEGWDDADSGDLSDFWGDADDAEQGDGEGGTSGGGSAETEATGEKTEAEGPAAYRAFEEECVFGGGTEEDDG